jgi:uncharacterized cupin superfamily protein
MVPEAPLERTEHGLVPQGEGWFVLNAREAPWLDSESLGAFCGFEGEPRFPQLGINLNVLQPGQPMSMYHWEDDQEGFLVLEGEALLLVEGQERQLRRWDLVHCPARTSHTIVGAGSGPCLILAVGSRTAGEDWGAYPADEAALRHDAGVESETRSGEEAYARFPEPERTAFRGHWLPDVASRAEPG